VYLHYDADTDWILNRPSAVSNNSSPSADRLADYTYQGLHRVLSRLSEEPSGTSADILITYSYDRFGRLQELKAENGSSTINHFEYGYNLHSQVAWREDKVSSDLSETFTHDGLHRLDVFQRGEMNQSHAIPSPDHTRDWGLDLQGNWLSIDTDTTTVYREHDRADRITDVDTGITGGDPVYDQNGNITFIHHPAPSSRTFIYDAWNRIVEVKAGGTPVARYTYDGLGRRIRNTLVGRSYYYSASWQLLAERNTSTNKTLEEIVWGARERREILARDVDDNSDGDTRDAGDKTYHYIQDRNWSVMTLCNKAGSVVERMVFDPYGLASFFDGSGNSISGTAHGNRFLFLGRLWSGLTYTYDFGEREYSPYLGRFLRIDGQEVLGDSLMMPGAADPVALQENPSGTTGGCCCDVDIAENNKRMIVIDQKKRNPADEAPSGSCLFSNIDEFKECIKCKDPRCKIRRLRVFAHGDQYHISAGGIPPRDGDMRTATHMISMENLSMWQDAFDENKFCHPCRIFLAVCEVGGEIRGTGGRIPPKIAELSKCHVEAPTGTCSFGYPQPYLPIFFIRPGPTLRFGPDGQPLPPPDPPPLPGYCFLGNTIVATPDGFLPIASIRPGDAVLGYNVDTGTICLAEVQKVCKAIVEEYYVIRLGEMEIGVTAEHQFYIKERLEWVLAKDLCPQARLWTINHSEVQIEDIKIIQATVEVYGMSVDDPNTFCVTKDGIIAHNKP
jgi:YD repeat-containing protein